MDTSSWKWFEVGKLFHLQKCKCSNASRLLEKGEDITYVGAKKSENGVMQYVNRVDELVSEGNCLVFIGDGQGSVGYCTYQPKEFIGSTTLIAGYRENLNPHIAHFLITILDSERFRYSFGRKYKKEVIAKSRIKLPKTADGAPDWQYMEDYIKNVIIPQLPEKAKNVWLKKYDRSPIRECSSLLGIESWQEFSISDLFEVQLTKGDIKADFVESGSIPLISSAESNNGIVKYISEDGDEIAKIFPRNTITLDMFCHAYYQNNDYYAVGHGRVNILLPKFELNKYIGMFLCTLINREAYRYSYGRAVYSSIAEKMNIRLPVIAGTHTPDWQFMEDYIKSLPYSKNI